MKKALLTGVLAIVAVGFIQAGLNPGDLAVNFTLPNVDGKEVSLSDYSDQKGVIVVFTCNPCPYAKAYEQRIIDLQKTYAKKGYPLVAINPNDVSVSPEDSMEKMKEKKYPFPYLKDDRDEVFKAYGATRTPHIYLLENVEGKFKVAYIGSIDDNAMDASAVKKTYLEDAIASLQSGSSPNPNITKAVGCSIKVKK